MNKTVKWPDYCGSGFFNGKFVFYSLLFLFVILCLDCFFQNLPISGYALIICILILTGCTTCFTCHGIKWIINSEKPLQIYFNESSENTRWLSLLVKYENDVFKNLLTGESGIFHGLKYPTNLSEQVRLLIKDIERDFIKTWYSEISQNPSFLFDSHLILEEIFFKIIKKLKTISTKNLMISILILYLNHLQEYKKLVKKMVRLKDDDSKSKIEVPDLCRYSHPGSQSDQILNYYLKKVAKSLLKEFASHDFAATLECKILGGIIGRKVLRRLLTTVEDPNWINFKLIYLLNGKKHKEILGNKIYIVKEKASVQEEEEFQFKKPALFSKRYFDLSCNIFDSSKNFFDRRKEFHGEDGAKAENREARTKPPEKEYFTLPLCRAKTPEEESKGNISTVLSGLISSTAGPLLPDNITVRYKAFNKMWQSPVSEVKRDISESISNSFHRVFDGVKDRKGIFRSRSTESLPDTSGSLRTKDVSVGEELCENVRFCSAESSATGKPKKLIKTRSFDSDSLMIEDLSDGEAAGLEKEEVGPEDQRNVSPVYEEPEDFATTIAKLRSLLQQRESNSTLSDKSSFSIDSQMGVSTDKSDNSLHSNRSWEGEPFDSQQACDIPTDGRLFVNICIPKGELVTDSGASPFVLYTIQYDGIYMMHNPSEDELVLQTTVVKRRFQEFLHLQAKLEENNSYKAIMKGLLQNWVKGPSKWVQLNFGTKDDDFASSGRRAMLESFLRQLCSKTEISNSQELHEFLGYGQSGKDAFIKKDADSSQRIDKLLANKVTGVFNSIKTALPSFDFDSAVLVATNDTVKSFQEQKLLQNFLNFGNKPEFFDLTLSFVVKEPTGDSFIDDIRNYLNEKSDCIEDAVDAVDALDSNDWLSEQRECRLLSAEEKCVWHGYRDVVLEDELEPLDSWLPVYSLFLDIICELLQDSDSWIIKEPVILLAKVISGHWEEKLEKELTTLDWDRIFANVIRLLRGLIFQSEESEALETVELETKKCLKEVILNLIPDWITEFVKDDGLSSAISLFVDSFQHFRLNRDVCLRLMDILLAHLLSCHHLALDSKR